MENGLAENSLALTMMFIAETFSYFEGLEKSYVLEGIRNIEKRWIESAELKCDYVKTK